MPDPTPITETHLHNTYCTDQEHCDLHYSSIANLEVASRHFKLLFRDQYGLEVTRVEEATEAPDLEDMPQDQLVDLIGQHDDNTNRGKFLVWWRAPA